MKGIHNTLHIPLTRALERACEEEVGVGAEANDNGI
jgi:hypothetical protein